MIIPCFNDGPLAIEAVRSVQETEEVELVVIDDGSSDFTTEEALSGLARSGVAILRGERRGLAAARMAGVCATSAPYIYPLDADDLLLPGSLSMLANALDGAPDAAFAYGDYEIFGDYEGYYHAPAHFDRWALLYTNPIPVGSLVRRDALLEAGGWRGGWTKQGYEDWDLWLALAERDQQAVCVERAVYSRRIHGSRMLRDARVAHRQIYVELCQRHSGLFAQRKDLRRENNPPLWKRIFYPIVLGKKHLPIWFESRLKRQLAKRGLAI